MTVVVQRTFEKERTLKEFLKELKTNPSVGRITQRAVGTKGYVEVTAEVFKSLYKAKESYPDAKEVPEFTIESKPGKIRRSRKVKSTFDNSPVELGA